MQYRGRKYFFIFIYLLFFSRIFCYDYISLSNEQNKTLVFRNGIIKDSICSYLSIKRIQPVLDISGRQTFSIDISYGYVVSPLFFYNFNKSDYPLFGEDEKIFNTIETKTFNLSFSGRFFNRFILTGDIGYLPEMEFSGSSEENFKINVSLYYNIIKDALFLTGLSAGIGYNYTSGEKVLQKEISRTIDETPIYFSGKMNSYWNYNGVNLSIFLNNQLLIFNFWGRADYYLLSGEIKSEFEGESSFSVPCDNNSIDHSILQGIVLSGGMEIALGWFKINVEAGRDVLSSGMYLNAGIRIGY